MKKKPQTVCERVTELDRLYLRHDHCAAKAGDAACYEHLEFWNEEAKRAWREYSELRDSPIPEKLV